MGRRAGRGGGFARDPAALEAFYREHVEAVQRFVARRVGDPHLAADLTAEIFLAAIESSDGYRPSDGNPTGWLYGVARNVVSASFRRGGRERRALGRVAGRELLDDDDIDRMVDRLDAEASARRLYEAMDDLPPGERAVLELVALDGLGTAEAARALHITAVAARVRLHRARRRLRPRLTPPDQRPDQRSDQRSDQPADQSAASPVGPAMTLRGMP